MAQTVIGFFENTSDAQRAVEKLQSAGISRDRVDISSGSVNSGSGNVSNDRESENGITRFFKSLFGDDSDDDVNRYSSVARNSTTVTVHAQSSEEAERAADLLDEYGAVNVDERASQYGYASTGSDIERSDDRRRETTIPRVQENLEVGKRTEERGGVRVRSRIVERPVEENIRLREEHVHVERQAVNRPVSESDINALQDRNIELTERAEVPVVNKEARVVEEVRIGKEVAERNETIRDTVRNTEIDVDRIEGNENRDSRDTTGTRNNL